MPADPTKPFDVAVVMFTKRAGSLAGAVRSIFAQQFTGRVQILVGTDGAQADRAALAALAHEVPATMALTVVDPGYSTARSRAASARHATTRRPRARRAPRATARSSTRDPRR
jgi:hypothetical protein